MWVFISSFKYSSLQNEVHSVDTFRGLQGDWQVATSVFLNHFTASLQFLKVHLKRIGRQKTQHSIKCSSSLFRHFWFAKIIYMGTGKKKANQRSSYRHGDHILFPTEYSWVTRRRSSPRRLSRRREKASSRWRVRFNYFHFIREVGCLSLSPSLTFWKRREREREDVLAQSSVLSVNKLVFF